MHYELLYTIIQDSPYPPDPPFHVQPKPRGVTRLPRLLLINPYRIAGVWVARITIKSPWYRRRFLNLEVSSGEYKKLEKILLRQVVRRLSPMRMHLRGIEGSLFPFILFVLIPLTIIAIITLLIL